MHRWCPLLLLLITLTVVKSAAIASETPKLSPPFKQSWMARCRADSTKLTKDSVYYSGPDYYGAVDIHTGQILWQKGYGLLREGYPGHVEGDETTFYILCHQWHLAACDARTGRKLWSMQCGDYPGPMALYSNILYCEYVNGQLFALSTTTRRTLWKLDLGPCQDKSKYELRSGLTAKPLIYDGRLFVASRQGCIYCLDPTTGRIRWKATLEPGKDYVYATAISADSRRVYVSTNQNKLTALNISSGAQEWEYQTEYHICGAAATLKGIVFFFTTNYSSLYALDAATGQHIWSKEKIGGFSAPPVVNRDEVIVYNTGMLTAYGMSGEQIWTWCTDVVTDRTELAAMPDGIMITKDALVRWVMVEEEVPQLDIPGLLTTLDPNQRDKVPYWDDKARKALDQITTSRDPRVIDFFISQLRDATAPHAYRQAAYFNLAVTGGEKGLAAVLDAQDQGRGIAPLAVHMCIADIAPDAVGKYNKGSQLIEMKTDSKGITWGLFTSETLGHYKDLWIARLTDGKWEDPLFTGITKDQLGNDDWLQRFKDRSGLVIDWDCDGWTDLVELRLGTKIDNPDSDGDGLNDSIDRNPLVAPRKLKNDVEKIVAAAFEARFKDGGKSGAAPILLRYPEGIEPFELHGWEWVIIPDRGEGTSPLHEVSGHGVMSVWFGPPTTSFDDISPAEKCLDGFILWNENHTEAKIRVHEYTANLAASSVDMHLRKFGDHWVVIGMGIFIVS